MFGKKKSKIKNCVGHHISGLDIPNIDVSVSLSEDGLKISAPSIKKEYSIALERLQNISFYDETEFEKHINSSFVGGIVGATAFGITGAIIGSRPNEKTKRKVYFYLLIDYSDNQIIIQSEDGFSVGSIIDYFRKLKPESNNISQVEL